MTITPTKRVVLLAVALILIVAGISYLEGQKPSVPEDTPLDAVELGVSTPPAEKKVKMLPQAREFADPSGFINTDPFTLADHIGKDVILVDFWTYSCINCQRTLPYITAWWDKYKDDGLLIVGVHTPEFEFEKDIDNVRRATEKFGVEYPVVLDNDYGTWRAYANRYWPRKYLIDIDGYIVYDHIGEGGYAETERKIQELLKERAERLGESADIAAGTVSPANAESAGGILPRTPEIYFGYLRNEYLANGKRGLAATDTFISDGPPDANRFDLDGGWTIEPEYAENLTAGAKIVLHYRAQKVFMVAGGKNGTVKVKLLLDGRPIGRRAGSDVTDDGTVTIDAQTLYRLVEDASYGDHVLEIIIGEPGLQAFTFTFG